MGERKQEKQLGEELYHKILYDCGHNVKCIRSRFKFMLVYHGDIVKGNSFH